MRIKKDRSRAFVYIQDVAADPPIFLLKSQEKCPVCSGQNQILITGARGIAIENKPKNQPHLFYRMTEMPDLLLSALESHPFFKKIFHPQTGISFYTNTCGNCGAVIGDFSLLARSDDPLAEERSIYDIGIEELPIAETIVLRAQIKRLPRAFVPLLELQGILSLQDNGP